MMRPNLPQAGSIARSGTTKTAHIMIPDAWWVMTYRGQVCQIKDTDQYRDEHHRYRRNGWTSETTARTQAEKLNQIFHTEDFAVRQVQGMDHGTS